MATILEFRAERASRQSRSVKSTSAQIVVFPGVRYEYVASATAAAPKARRKAPRKRDKLELK